MNNRISHQREEIAKKEQKYIRTGPGSEMDLEIGQPIWHQDPHTKKWHPRCIHEELEEPYSYSIEDATGQIYRRNRNWIKPRPVDTDATTLMEDVPDSDSRSPPCHDMHSSPEASASNPVASQTPVDVIPTAVTNDLQNTSARGSPVTCSPVPGPRISTRINKGVAPRRLGWDE